MISGGRRRTTLSPAPMTSSFCARAAATNSVLGSTSAQAHHEALAAHIGDDARMAVLQLGEPLLEQQALALDLLQEAGLQDHVEHRVAHRHGERVAAEGGAVGADRHALGGLGRGEAGAHREAAADALGRPT